MPIKKEERNFLAIVLTISTGKTEFFLHNRDTPEQLDRILQNFSFEFPFKKSPSEQASQRKSYFPTTEGIFLRDDKQ